MPVYTQAPISFIFASEVTAGSSSLKTIAGVHPPQERTTDAFEEGRMLSLRGNKIHMAVTLQLVSD